MSGEIDSSLPLAARVADEFELSSDAIAPRSVADFCDRLIRSGALLKRELDAFMGSPTGWRSAADVAKLADALVADGLLTPWQRKRLWSKRTDDLRIDRYLLLDPISEGGFGLIYRARHVYMDRIVALKLLRPTISGHQDTLARFHREVAASGKLDHPNILRAYDVFEYKTTLVLVLEYTSGPNLFELVQQTGPMPVLVACDCISQAAGALTHVHRMGMIHRDVKPSNMILIPRPDGANEHSWGAVKLLDMGLVRLMSDDKNAQGHDTSVSRSAPITAGGSPATDSLEDSSVRKLRQVVTRPGSVLGTVEFMAPEQAVDTHSVSLQADLYSLGATLFFLLTGRPPLGDQGHFVMKLLRLTKETPPPVRSLRPDCPPELEALIARLLAKQCEQRPQTAEQVAAALTPFMPHATNANEPPHAPSQSNSEGDMTPIAMIREMKDRLDQAAGLLGQFDTRFGSRLEQSEEIEQQLAARSADSQRLNQALVEVQEQAKRQLEQLRRQADEIDRLNSSLAEQSSRATQLESELADRDGRVADLSRNLEEEQSRSDQLRRDLAGRNARLCEIEGSLAEGIQLVRQFEDQFKARSQQTEIAERALAEAIGHAQRTDHELLDCRRQLAERQNEIDDWQRRCHEQTQRVCNLRQQLKQIAASLDVDS